MRFSNATVGVFGVQLAVYGMTQQNLSITFTNGSDYATYSLNQGDLIAVQSLQFAVKGEVF